MKEKIYTGPPKAHQNHPGIKGYQMNHSNDQHQTPIQVIFFGSRGNGDMEEEINISVAKLIRDTDGL
jgi:hypothetical protein